VIEQAAAQRITAAIEQEFPGWRVWRTADAGTWWASRRGLRWMCEPRTVAGDTPDDLRAELREAWSADCPGVTR
jgi:hypothetical protein